MAKKTTINDLSAEELYALAQQKEQEEHEQEREAVRAQIESLRNERRELVAKQRKQLAALDTKIRKLGGRTRSSKGRAKGNVTDQVLSIVQSAGKISTKDIKAALESQGITANNLSQTLAYLKRTGRVTSPARSMYSIA